MNNRNLAWASGILLLAVALGAFGAHGLEARVDENALHNWSTGVQYQFYHGLALLVLAVSDIRLNARAISMARNFLLAGVFLFSGSLYLLATRELLGTNGLTPVLGPITPLGGLCFLAGWGTLLAGALRRG